MSEPVSLRPAVRRYAWGDPAVLPAMFGAADPSVVADGGPWAEAWFGTHPVAPTPTGGGSALADVIAADPIGALGAEIAQRFGNRLPFLVKVLTAAQPLSLQTHPDADRAAAGFAREEAAGVPLTAPERLYRDPFHKPELLCALGPFEALSGFRAASETAEHLSETGLTDWADRLRRDGLVVAFRSLLAAPDDAQQAAVERAVAGSALAARLHELYPGDVGCVAALFLHHVTLEAGEALYLGAGNLHAYLHGSAVEVMSASDNVLRGGLTPKHVDVAELLAALHIAEGPAPLIRADGSGRYRTPAAEFELRRVGEPAAIGGPAIVLHTDEPNRGRAWFVPHGVSHRARLGAWVTTVPD